MSILATTQVEDAALLEDVVLLNAPFTTWKCLVPVAQAPTERAIDVLKPLAVLSMRFLTIDCTKLHGRKRRNGLW